MIKPVVQIVENRIPELNGYIKREVASLTMETALGIQGRIRTGMADAKHGRVYMRRGRAHQASAPGEMPAIDTGHLANSMQVERMGDGVSTAVFTAAEYAEVLELGGVHIAPRPYMVPATESAVSDFVSAVSRLLSDF